MILADILSRDCVIACHKIASKRQLLQKVADTAAKRAGIDAQVIYETLTNREQLGSTGIGNGLAIPHGKLEGLDQVVAVFARLDQPIEFDSVDDRPVDLVIALLAPTGAGADHLKALAHVARLMRTESLVDSLRQTREADKLYAILTEPGAAENAA